MSHVLEGWITCVDFFFYVMWSFTILINKLCSCIVVQGVKGNVTREKLRYRIIIYTKYIWSTQKILYEHPNLVNQETA